MNDNILKKTVKLFIKDGSYLSLVDIHEFKAKKCSVLRSAHVGNLDSQTLFLAKEGFSVILDEYARGSMRVYKPAYKIKSDVAIALSDRDDLSALHLCLGNDLDNNVASFHYKNLVSLFPNSIKLTSTHLLKNKKIIYEAFKILAQKRPSSFTKLIDENGNVFKFAGSEEEKIYFCDDLGNCHIFNVFDIPDIVISGLENAEKLIQEGGGCYSKIIVLDVDTDIILLTLCDINWSNLNFDFDEIKVIHFSGLEMINYMVKDKVLAEEHLQAMNEILNLLIHLWTTIIPNKIEMLIVPTDALRYFICGSQRELKILSDSILSTNNINVLTEHRKMLWKKYQDEIVDYVLTLTDENIMALIKDIDDTNTPDSFIKTLNNVRNKIDNKVVVERQLLNRIISNYLLYKKISTTAIPKIENKIFKEKNVVNRLKGLKSFSLTQYDLIYGKKMYFPNEAYVLSLDELKKFSRRNMKNENK